MVGDSLTRAIDGRYPAWDPPAQALATLCHFAPISTDDRFQVLARTDDRCGDPQAAGSVVAREGEVVDVPAAGAGEVVFARIEGAGVSGLEKAAERPLPGRIQNGLRRRRARRSPRAGDGG